MASFAYRMRENELRKGDGRILEVGGSALELRLRRRSIEEMNDFLAIFCDLNEGVICGAQDWTKLLMRTGVDRRRGRSALPAWWTRCRGRRFSECGGAVWFRRLGAWSTKVKGGSRP